MQSQGLLNFTPVGETTLKVALAMGGGVSLGAFSGSALAESLIWLNLYGLDKKKRRYKRVIVDSFSGASAGSMSLLVMLRYLVSSPVTLEKINEALSDNNPPNEKDIVYEAVTELNDDHPQALVTLWQNKERQRVLDLVALKVMQMKQKEIWTGLELTNLLDCNAPSWKRGGLLSREALEAIAQEHLKGIFQSEPCATPPVLNSRVAFSSTLSCLTPVVHDSRHAFNIAKPLFGSVSDGLTSRDHRDQRVFDLCFNEINPDVINDIKQFNTTRFQRMSNLDFTDIPQSNYHRDQGLEVPSSISRYPLRWVRAHNGPFQKRVAYNLFSPALWAKLAATSLASGAFPGAFDPVPLRRSWWEYGVDQWPQHLRIKQTTEADFLFVDGGLMDNEPIRQAFRLASFFDSESIDPEDHFTMGENLGIDEWVQRESQRPLFERVVLFVDPNVSHDPNKASARLELWNSENHNQHRLPEVLKSIVSVLIDEASVLEANKVEAILNLFEERERFKWFIEKAFIRPPSDLEPLLKLSIYLENFLSRSIYQILPATPCGLKGEVKRVLWEVVDGKQKKFENRIRPFYKLELLMKLFRNRKLDQTPDKLEESEYVNLVQVLLVVMADRLMDLEGKSRNSQLIAISPFTYQCNEKKEGNKMVSSVEATQFPMPAGEFFGFGGIMSKAAATHASEVGKYCAANILIFIAAHPELSLLHKLDDFKKPKSDTTSRENKANLPSLNLDRLAANANIKTPKERDVSEALTRGKEEIYGHIVKVIEKSYPVTHLIPDFIKKWVLSSFMAPPNFVFPLRIIVPRGSSLYLRGRWYSLFHSPAMTRAIDQTSEVIMTYIEEKEPSVWRGNNITVSYDKDGEKLQLKLYTSRVPFLGKERVITLPDPSELTKEWKQKANKFAYPCLQTDATDSEPTEWKMVEGTLNSCAERFEDIFNKTANENVTPPREVEPGDSVDI